MPLLVVGGGQCSDAVSESQASYLYQIPEPEAALA
jgi:hypothetical protein